MEPAGLLKGWTLIQPLIPNGALMRPISTSVSGGCLLNCGNSANSTFGCGELLAQTLHGIGRLRAYRPPMRQTRPVKAERFVALRRLRVVKSDTLDKTTVTGATRIRDDEIEKGTLFGATTR